MNVKGPTFEIKEYAFSVTPEGSTDKFKTRAELFDKCRDEWMSLWNCMLR